jgi:hypothetical protein
MFVTTTLYVCVVLQSAGGTVEAAAAAPSDAFGVVREAIVTSVTTISVPFRAPIQSAKVRNKLKHVFLLQ